MAKNFKDLSEQEILALAISSEETDARIYADFAAGLKADYPATAQIFEEMEADVLLGRAGAPVPSITFTVFSTVICSALRVREKASITRAASAPTIMDSTFVSRSKL